MNADFALEALLMELNNVEAMVLQTTMVEWIMQLPIASCIGSAFSMLVTHNLWTQR